MLLRIKIPSRKRNRTLPIWLWLFFAVLILFSAGAGAALGIRYGYEYNLPNVQSLEDYRPDVITEVFADDGRVIGELYLERRIIVSYEEIPLYLQMAILATEDKHFYTHSGINYFSIVRAVTKDLIRRSFPIGKGASTITQQLSRMLLLTNRKTYDRKIKEILIAWKIEKMYSKQQILALYCNLHPMGHGLYGVAAAADGYFGKRLKDLTLEECALIAGLPSNPTRYSPRLHPTAAVGRRNLVLSRMADEGMIEPELASQAKRKPLTLTQHAPGDGETAPHFLENVRQYLASRYSTDEIWRRGLQVYTTLNAEMQEAAYTALINGLEKYDRKTGWRGPIVNIAETAESDMNAYAHPGWRAPLTQGRIIAGLVEGFEQGHAIIRIKDYRGRIGPEEIRWTGAESPAAILKSGDLAWFRIHSFDDNEKTVSLSLDQRPKVDGAIIVLENGTGAIKAMVGGYDFRESEFNRATQAMRQIGSTIKPLVYSAAFEKGLTQESIIQDTPFLYTDDLGRPWEPRNYDGEFKGEITVRQALTESRNVPTIKVAADIGIENVVVMARRFGLTGSIKPYLSLAVGACEVTPLEMASAFTVFPNLGIQARPYFIRKVEDYTHRIKEENRPETHRVLDPGIAEEILDLLCNVVENGTAKKARSLGRPLGGKTGTTQDFTDAWFIGFTPSLTAAVWVGHDRDETLGEGQSGSVVALPIWIEFMERTLKDRPIENFPSFLSGPRTPSASPSGTRDPAPRESISAP
ncbi:MAG: PBP1A family penicillin-binding protein [Acidobacteria bacterium]|nr:PBP1A family penicillin-binding protein [Acidobacteriota bacterium]